MHDASRRSLFARLPRIDPGLALALALALIAALPFLTRPGLPRGTDAELHVFRAAELGYSLRAGDLYPRWAPDFYYGYGYPIFNYYAPLTYHLANLFDLLPGVDVVGGVKAVFVLGLVAASVGTYLFVRDWLGPRPGLLAATLYLFSPYVILIDPHLRGVLAESFSMGLFPMALWAYQRTFMPVCTPTGRLVDGRRRWIVMAALFQAALIMSHNLLGLVFTGLLVAYLAWSLLIRPLIPAPGPALAPLAALGLGVGLSAIFWLPMVLERGDVQLTLTGPGHFDFHNHFVSLGTLLKPSPILDLGATVPRFSFNLGLAQWTLALVALPALISRPRNHRRRLTAFFVLCAAGLVALMLPLSTPVWELVPGMAFLQFPWRLLGPAGAVLSIAAAAGYAQVIRRPRWRVAALGAGVGLALFLALPTMFPPLWQADFGPTDPASIIQYELAGVAVGTTSTGDYLPTTVETQPRPEPAYLASYAAPGDKIDKVNRATLPQDTVVTQVSHGPTHDRFQVTSRKPFLLRLFTFYFPGWQATVDGHKVPIELGRPEGFIIVPVPAGTHAVEVRLAPCSTPTRAAGTLISLLALLALAGMTAWGLVRSGEKKIALHLGRPAWPVAGGVILAFFLFKVGLVDRQHTWFRRTSPPGQVLGMQHPLTDPPVEFGHHIQLLGYDLSRFQVRSGDTLPLTLYWRATASVPENYQVFVHLTRPITHLWGQSDNLNPGDFPTRRWPLEKYVWDEHELAVLPGTPPGEYRLTVGLYDLGSGLRVPVFDGSGNPLGDTFTLPTPVRVTRPRRPPALKTLGLTDELGLTYGDQITLLGAVLTDRHIELPGFLHLGLLWRAETDHPQEVTVEVQLVDANGQVTDEIVRPPVDGRYPPPSWSEGEIVRDQYSFWLTPDLAPGEYTLRVRLDGAARDWAEDWPKDWIGLGTVQVGDGEP